MRNPAYQHIIIVDQNCNKQWSAQYTPDRRQLKTLLAIDERGSKIARSSFFDCRLLPLWRQMAIENSDANLSIVLTFSISAYPVWNWFYESQKNAIHIVLFVCVDVSRTSQQYSNHVELFPELTLYLTVKINSLAQGHNTVPPLRLKPGISLSIAFGKVRHNSRIESWLGCRRSTMYQKAPFC